MKKLNENQLRKLFENKIISEHKQKLQIQTSDVPLGKSDDQIKQSDEHAHAAVLIPVICYPNELTVLFTKRTHDLATHAGQISFPGGRYESHDNNLLQTALRESEEEIDLKNEDIEVIGELNSIHSITGYLVYSYIALVQPNLQLKPDPKEVAEIFEVPLEYLLDQANYQQRPVIYRGKEYELISIEYGGKVIWGLTAKILYQLIELINKTNGDAE